MVILGSIGQKCRVESVKQSEEATMFKTLLLLPLAFAAFVRVVGAQAPPPDGSPNIAGTWVGSIKFKFYDQHEDDDDRGNGKLPVQIEITQTAADVNLTIFVDSDEGMRQFVLSGHVGRGHVWAFLEEPGEVFLLSGHVKKTTMKGQILVAEDATVSEVKFRVKRSAGTPHTGGPGTPSGEPDGLPAIQGSWSGKHSRKGFAQYDTGAEKGKGKGKNPIALAIAQVDANVTVTYTVFTDEGQDEIPLAGEHGHGHFWATGTHPRGGPMMVIGHVKKGKIKGLGLATFDGGVFSAKFNVRTAP